MDIPIHFAAGVFLLWIFPLTQVLIAFLGRKRKADGDIPLTPGNTLQRIYLVVPAMNEGTVIGNTVHALLNLPGLVPAHVLVVNDNSSDNTLQVLQQIDNPRLHVLTRRPPQAQQGKGEALNAAYRWICEQVQNENLDPRKTIVGIIDADGRPSTNTLNVLLRMFADKNISAVQTRVLIRNTDSFWGLIQNEEFSISVDAAQSLRDRLGSVALGGNGQYTRLDALQVLGPKPWSTCLVEDLDLGLRLHAQAHLLRYTNECSVSQQAVTHTRRLVKQRARWSQGNIQCLEHLKDVTQAHHLRKSARAEMLSYLAVSILAIFGSAAMVIGLASMLSHPLLDEVPDLLVWITALFAPAFMWAWLYVRRNGKVTVGTFTKLILGYPALVGVSTVAMLRAWVQHLSKKTAWAKTEREVEATV